MNAVIPSTASPRVADVLLSRTQQRVLGLLFQQPERSFFATELIQLAGCGSGTVQRELQRLSECGLIQINQQGKQKHYRVNTTTPVFAPLKQLLESLQSPITVLHQAFATLPKPVLFASLHMSENNSGATSWRLLVVADDLKLAEVFTALQPVEHTLNIRIQPVLYSHADFKQLRSRQSPALAHWLDSPNTVIVGNLATL